MKIDLNAPNPALESILKHSEQVITMDANFLIPPDRSRYTSRSFDLPLFQRVWLEPIFKAFPNLAIHESVYEELVMPSLKAYINAIINDIPPRLTVHKDSALTIEEKMLRDSIEEKIYPLTKYDPLLNNKDDRGEVKSLSYIAVKGLLYFAAHDSNAIQLIEKAAEWTTGLDNVQVIKMFELIFYLHKINASDKQALKMLYKYQYYLTAREKVTNPEWGAFLDAMEVLYPIYSIQK